MSYLQYIGSEKLPDYLDFGPIRPTLNHRGYAIEALDPFSRRYVEFASAQPQVGTTSIEIGAGYGFASFEAAKVGAKHLIVNEIDTRQLGFIERESKLHPDTRFEFMLGSVPALDLKPGLLNNILMCRVSHYLNGDEMDATLGLFFKALKPGGRVILVSETPYGASFERYIPIFESKKSQKQPWPGYINDLKSYMSQYSENNPESIHLLDPDTLRTTFEKHGFTIEESDYFTREEFPASLRLNPSHPHYGHESCGIIARKP